MISSPYIWDPHSSVSLTSKPRVPNRQTAARYDPCIARWADDGGQMHDRSHVYNADYLAPTLPRNTSDVTSLISMSTATPSMTYWRA